MSARFALVILFVLLTGLCQAQEPASSSQSDFEVAKDLTAATLLPEELLRGEHHVVDDRVRNDGYLNYYTIHSEYGEFEAASTAMLRIRIREIEALAELDELSHTEVFITAMADAGVQRIVGVQQLVMHPIQTAKGLPSGVGRMFKRYSRKSKEAVAATKEYMIEDSGDDPTMTKEENADQTAQAISLTERYFGVSEAERRWCKKLRVDPYSSNEILTKAIENVAMADSLGKTTVLLAGMAIPYVGYVNTVSEAVWSEDPYALRDSNRAALLATGADESLVDEYLTSPWLSPTQQTLLTAAIVALDNVDGRDGILWQALNARGETEVGYLVRAAGLLAWYHRNKEPFVSVSTELAIPGGVMAEGKSVLLFPSDHVYWTELMAEAAMEYRAVGSDQNEDVQEIWILGTTSDRVADELLALGYDLHTDFAEMVKPVAEKSEPGE